MTRYQGTITLYYRAKGEGICVAYPNEVSPLKKSFLPLVLRNWKERARSSGLEESNCHILGWTAWLGMVGMSNGWERPPRYLPRNGRYCSTTIKQMTCVNSHMGIGKRILRSRKEQKMTLDFNQRPWAETSAKLLELDLWLIGAMTKNGHCFSDDTFVVIDYVATQTSTKFTESSGFHRSLWDEIIQELWQSRLGYYYYKITHRFLIWAQCCSRTFRTIASSYDVAALTSYYNATGKHFC